MADLNRAEDRDEFDKVIKNLEFHNQLGELLVLLPKPLNVRMKLVIQLLFVLVMCLVDGRWKSLTNVPTWKTTCGMP